ncbi:MAG: blaR0 [Armatimonadetes bacterium]|jgi:hypothetical protein|nr:blaR0 [Armatimonadota bacterium]
MMRAVWLLALALPFATAAAADRIVGDPAPGLELGRALQATELAPTRAVARASVDGKYRNLLAVIRVPGDLETYSAFKDYGPSATASWGGYSGLPSGHWVYVYPHWYIWGEAVPGTSAITPDVAIEPSEKRSWGPEQAIGAPDTEQAGDIATAWASATQDEQDEWLQLDYGKPIQAVAVIVHESFNPGALTRITTVRPDTEEVDLWRGEDPTPAGRDHGVSIVTLKEPVEASTIRLYLASARVPGWNEIDAVGIIDSIGRTHWATRATASSTYAER